MLLRVVVPILLLLAGSLADPDFTGVWKLKQERRASGSIPAPAAVMKIERQEGVFGITETASDGARTAWFVRTDGKELKTKSGGAEMKCIGKWEADALLINTLVSGSKGDYAVMDRWDLSRDGATLTIDREVVRRTGTAESVLTYAKAQQ